MQSPIADRDLDSRLSADDADRLYSDEHLTTRGGPQRAEVRSDRSHNAMVTPASSSVERERDLPLCEVEQHTGERRSFLGLLAQPALTRSPVGSFVDSGVRRPALQAIEQPVGSEDTVHLRRNVPARIERLGHEPGA
jgi:hypothetical protein